MTRRSPIRGFTLIEVLVALAVVAIALSATLNGAGSQAANAVYLKQRTLAHWIAADRLTELQLGSEWPAPGTRTGQTRMASVDWYWSLRVQDTADRDVRRIDIEVRLDPERAVLTSLTGYLGRSR